MNSSRLKAVAVCREINLSKIASHFGIERKLSWEDTLALNEQRLSGILPQPADKSLFIFSFGSLVFVNFSESDIRDSIDYLAKVDRNIAGFAITRYTDDYQLTVGGDKLSVTYDELIAPTLEPYYLELIAVILAKSAALERIEDELSKLFDDVEVVINELEKGTMAISDERLAKLSGRILSYRYSSISYIMVLDKPDVVWRLQEAQELYLELEHVFELPDRYGKVTHKTETLLDITGVFADLYHAKRGTRLEWLVIILIAFEIVLGLVEKFWPL